MKIYDIDRLFRDENQDNLFNMFVITFKTDRTVPYRQYTVPEENEGRIDLICRDIYKKIDDIDIILNLNDIDNPLNIKAGTSLSYPSYTAISNFRVNTEEAIQTRATLLNANKLTRKDSSRQAYLENNQSLPPNIQKEPQPQVKVEGNRIVIG
jgi:hypothetical protein